MYEETTIVTPHGTVGSSTGHDPLDSVIAEIGATYPLMAYTAQAGEADETEAMNAAILAGMVSP
jgi:myo-inositol-hexaphosphate 3-phosphohydrolase